MRTFRMTMIVIATVSLRFFSRCRERLWSCLVGDDDVRPVVLRRTVLDFASTGSGGGSSAYSRTFLPTYILGDVLGSWVGRCVDLYRERSLARRIAPLDGGPVVEILECSSRGKIVATTRVLTPPGEQKKIEDSLLASIRDKESTMSSVWCNGSVAPNGMHTFVQRYVGLVADVKEDERDGRGGIRRDLSLAIAFALGYMERDPALVFSLLARPDRTDKLRLAQLRGNTFREGVVGSEAVLMK